MTEIIAIYVNEITIDKYYTHYLSSIPIRYAEVISWLQPIVAIAGTAISFFVYHKYHVAVEQQFFGSSGDDSSDLSPGTKFQISKKK